MKKGRKKDHVWKFYKYKGDMAIYAQCSCGFKYGCNKSFEQKYILDKLYPYCPYCGSRKTRYSKEIIKKDCYPW